MKFTLTIEIQPAGAFGVPEGETVVVPAKPGTITGHTFHTDTGIMAGYGTLSEFRADKDAIRLNLSLSGANIRFRDNFAFIDVDVNEPGKAYRVAISIGSRLLRHLMISSSRLFTFQPLILESADRTVYPLPKHFDLGRLTTYNLTKLRDQLEQSASFIDTDDAKLALAIDYLQHGLILFENGRMIVGVWTRQHSMVISSAFLSVWKAITAVIGDPSVDRDYQSRYKQIGIDFQFFVDKIEMVRKLRNDYDVAHYSLDPADIKEVEKSFGSATEIAVEVLSRYRNMLSAP